MVALVLLVVTVALADSLNPSTVAPALYYATTARARPALAGLAAGAFLVYFAGGVVVLLGGRRLVTSLLPHVSGHTKHLLEVAGGVVVLVVAGAIWRLRGTVADRAGRPRGGRAWSSFLVGAGIMAFELPTAFPLFAAIAAIGASGQGTATAVALVALYAAIFVGPLLAILAVRMVAGPRSERLLVALRGWTERHAAAVLAGALGAVGVAGVAVGAAGLA